MLICISMHWCQCDWRHYVLNVNIYIYILLLANILRWKVWKRSQFIHIHAYSVYDPTTEPCMTWKKHLDSIWQHPISTPGCGGSISWTRREKCIHALGRRSRHCSRGGASSSCSSLFACRQVFGFGTIVMLHSGNGLSEIRSARMQHHSHFQESVKQLRRSYGQR